VSSVASLPHLLLLLIGAFLVGLRAYRATQPARTTGDVGSRQLFRFVSAASFGLFLLMLAVVAALDLRLFHMTRTSW
jgi:hypothetical protein